VFWGALVRPDNLLPSVAAIALRLAWLKYAHYVTCVVFQDPFVRMRDSVHVVVVFVPAWVIFFLGFAICAHIVEGAQISLFILVRDGAVSVWTDVAVLSFFAASLASRYFFEQ
jgi:hypothetical protein